MPPNGDAMLIGTGADPGLFAVADGSGGSREAASSLAVTVLADLGPGGSLDKAFGWANREIFDGRRAGRADGARADARADAGVASLVALRVTERAAAAEICHVGDSRAYLLRGGILGRLTEDHSLASVPVRPRAAGASGAGANGRPARGDVVARALGRRAEVRVDRELVGIRPGDRFVLCSDGLSDFVPDAEIRRVLDRTAGDPQAAAWDLAASAARTEADDDLTVVVVDVAAAAGRANLGAPGDR